MKTNKKLATSTQFVKKCCKIVYDCNITPFFLIQEKNYTLA